MAELAATACTRCREQKLRCSREKPACARCTRLRADCGYPTPPDRKSLAAARVRKQRKSKPDGKTPPGAGFALGSTVSTSPGTHDTRPISSSHSNGIANATPPIQHYPSEDAQSILREVYFACGFNASLIFHQPSFEQALLEGRADWHSQLAIWAIATVYLPPGSVRARQHAAALQHLGNLQERGNEWALQAGRITLADCDQPTIPIIQTCEVLGHYWFARGDAVRNTMFNGIASRAIRALRLDERQIDADTALTYDLASATLPPWLKAEKCHRIYWASWITNLVNSDHYIVGTSSNPPPMTVPLPMSEEGYQFGVEEPLTNLDERLSLEALGGDPRSSGASVSAELVSAVFFWARVRDHIELREARQPKSWLPDLLQLDDDLQAWAASLPHELVYSRRTLYEYLIVKQQSLFVVAHMVYHQCRLVLHSSMVPRLSGISSVKGVPAQAIRLSAHIAVHTALTISQIAADILALEWDAAKLAPFFGYAMYAAASIHISLIFARDAKQQRNARNGLAQCLQLLKQMKPYWKNLERLWARIHVLYEAQVQEPPLASQQEELEAGTDELQELASSRRDLSGLTEPLAESTLVYSLRRVRRDVKVDQHSPAAQMLQSATYLDEVADLLNAEKPHHGYNNAAYDTTALSGPAPPATMTMHLDSSVLQTSQSYFPGGQSVPLEMNGFGTIDWWQTDMDNFSQPILSYDDLIRFNQVF